MSLAKTYTPNDFEPSIYALWESSGAFRPSADGEPYSIVLPPPNANGNLHIGHGLAFNLQDILIRFHRMRGYSTAYIPGADHAGFETWVVYEKYLESIGKTRFEFSREELYQQVWDFVAQKRGDMELQLRALGLSLDWESLVFTLDSKVVDTVYTTFEKLMRDGLMYRDKRLVNYCTKHQTSFADLEVEHKTEKSKLWQIAYPLTNEEGEIIVATTRPETMLGDTAVAVAPDDERYAHLVGQTVTLPLTGREVPIVADEYVEAEFGTGAVKITPAHDPNDFEIGQRHDLEQISVIDFDGTMINTPEKYLGLTFAEARNAVLEDLESGGFRRGESELEHSVGHCYKCGTVIQPLLKDQWFIRMQPLAERAIAVLEAGEVTFTPANKASVLVEYLRNLRDWNVSRQIAWGIPIPAFQNAEDPSDWIFDTRVDQPTLTIDGTTYIRDEDTFDTWFSSGQWPFVTTDYLQGGELAKFFPTSVMSTGQDIMYFWVARMIMLSLYVTDQVPFRHVYLNGMVNDEHNQKMSKSKGNVVNPMEVIAEYGSDAFRMGIISSRSAAQNQAYSPSKVVAGRNFCNKLWNIARFIEGTLPEHYAPAAPNPVTIADHWVLRQLATASTSVAELLAEYRFAEAAEVVYHTIWDDIADWYIESAKNTDNPDMAVYVLENILRLAHPFVPFVTETIWQGLPWTDNLLMTQTWPEITAYDDISAAQFDRLRELVVEARFVMAELPGNVRYDLHYGDDSLVADNAAVIRHLGKFNSVSHTDTPAGLRLAASGRDAWIAIDADTLYEHQTNLEKRLAETRVEIARVQGRLSNESYIAKAPAPLVEESRQNLAELKQREDRLVAELSVL